MSLRPVDSQEDHLHLLHNSSVHRAEGDPRHPNRQCSRHDIPPVVLTSLPAEGGTISPQGSRPAGPKCSPLGGSDDPPIIGERPLLLGGPSKLGAWAIRSRKKMPARRCDWRRRKPSASWPHWTALPRPLPASTMRRRASPPGSFPQRGPAPWRPSATWSSADFPEPPARPGGASSTS